MAAVIVDDLCAKFRSFWLTDPIMVAMERGNILWGDLLMTDAEQKFHSEWAAAHAPALPPIVETWKPETPLFIPFDEEAAAWSKPVTRVIVPSFTVGIKTVITRNLPRSITVEQLRAVFEQYGPIKDIYIPKNMEKTSPYFGTIKGFALIKFLKPEHSAAAYQGQYGRLTISGNNISVEFAKEDR